MKDNDMLSDETTNQDLDDNLRSNEELMRYIDNLESRLDAQNNINAVLLTRIIKLEKFLVVD